MDARGDLVHFLLLFGAFVTWNCLVESKTDQNDVESIYQAMSDRISTLEAALLHQPAEIQKLRQEYRSEIDLLKKQHDEQISVLRQEIVSLRLEKETQIQELKEEVTTLRLEQDSKIQVLTQLVFPHVVENVDVDVNVDKQENDSISTTEMSETEKRQGSNGTKNHQLVTNQPVSSSRKMRGSSKSRIIKRQAEATDHVAFFAKLSTSSLNMGENQVIVFENCVTNVGNAYDSHVGVFKAPLPGVYLFSTTITSYNSNSGHVWIFINDVAETQIYVNGAENAWDETSQTIIVSLKQGDDVTVRTQEMGHGIAGWSHSIFSGVLLFEDVGQGSIVG